MPELKRVGSLDIEQNPKFMEQDWRFQRIGMAGMLVVAVLALAGVTGSGLLSSTAAASGRLHVNYNRFCHRDAPARIIVETDAPANGSPLQIWLGTGGGYFPNRSDHAGTRQRHAFRTASRICFRGIRTRTRAT